MIVRMPGVHVNGTADSTPDDLAAYPLLCRVLDHGRPVVVTADYRVPVDVLARADQSGVDRDDIAWTHGLSIEAVNQAIAYVLWHVAP